MIAIIWERLHPSKFSSIQYRKEAVNKLLAMAQDYGLTVTDYWIKQCLIAQVVDGETLKLPNNTSITVAKALVMLWGAPKVAMITRFTKAIGLSMISRKQGFGKMIVT